MAAEVGTQPDDWLAVAARVPVLAGSLPRPGERVAVVGCGSSLHVARAYSALREGSGGGLTDAWSASEHRLGRGYDRVVAMTRSGTTTEVLRVLEDLRGRVRTTVVTADPASPVVDVADDVVALPSVDERSVVSTRFATTVLALLRAHLGHDLSVAAAQARDVLADGSATVEHLTGAAQVTFVGRGWTVGLADEAALKLRESTQLWVESYPATEYRHGPISVAAPGRVTWALGEVPTGLADAVRATGAHLEHAGRDPLAELVRVHLLCLAVAARRGLDPDRPRHLARSVILSA